MDHYDLEYETAKAFREEVIRRLQERLARRKQERLRKQEVDGDQHR
jgi:hypothetical protein